MCGGPTWSVKAMLSCVYASIRGRWFHSASPHRDSFTLVMLMSQ